MLRGGWCLPHPIKKPIFNKSTRSSIKLKRCANFPKLQVQWARIEVELLFAMAVQVMQNVVSFAQNDFDPVLGETLKAAFDEI